jgi:hypothetical protein
VDGWGLVFLLLREVFDRDLVVVVVHVVDPALKRRVEPLWSICSEQPSNLTVVLNVDDVVDHSDAADFDHRAQQPEQVVVRNDCERQSDDDSQNGVPAGRQSADWRFEV